MDAQYREFALRLRTIVGKGIYNNWDNFHKLENLLHDIAEASDENMANLAREFLDNIPMASYLNIGDTAFYETHPDLRKVEEMLKEFNRKFHRYFNIF